MLSKDEDKRCQTMAIVHKETSTGVTSDVAKARFHTVRGVADMRAGGQVHREPD